MRTETRTRNAKCGCTYSETRDKNGTLLYTDEGMCEEHASRVWEKVLDDTTPHTRYINPRTVNLNDEQQARMKELMEDQG